MILNCLLIYIVVHLICSFVLIKKAKIKYRKEFGNIRIVNYCDPRYSSDIDLNIEITEGLIFGPLVLFFYLKEKK